MRGLLKGRAKEEAAMRGILKGIARGGGDERITKGKG